MAKANVNKRNKKPPYGPLIVYAYTLLMYLFSACTSYALSAFQALNMSSNSIKHLPAAMNSLVKLKTLRLDANRLEVRARTYVFVILAVVRVVVFVVVGAERME